MKAYLSVARQVPEFVRAEYPAFLEFLKAYYQWYEEQYSVGKVGDVTSLDRAPAEFLKYFRKQLDVFGITANTDNRMFLEHIKEMYTAKGSAASVDFLFKVIFNKPATVIQPWNYVFKPSDGKWTQDTSIIVEYIPGLEQLLNTSVIISDSEGREYKTYVRAVLQRPDNSAEIFVTRFAPLSDLLNVRSVDGTITTNILKVFVSVKIADPGAGYRVGFVGATTVTSGDVTSDIVYKVKAVDANGGIKTIEILTFGRSFDFAVADVFPDHGLETVGNIQFYPGTFCVYPGYYLDGTNIIGDLVYIQDSYYYQIHSYVTVVEESLDKYGALLQQVLHPTGTKQFATLLLDDVFQLALDVDPQLNLIDRADALREFLLLEGEPFFEVVKQLETSTTTSDEFQRVVNYVRGAADGFADTFTVADAYDLLVAKGIDDGFTTDDVIAFVTDFGRSFQSIVAATDAVVIDSGKGLAHSVATIDVLQRAAVFIRSLEESATVDDALQFQVSTPLSDTAFVTDTITIVPGIGEVDTIVTTDSKTFVVDKYVGDAIQTSNSGAIYGTPFYTDVPTQQYWEVGYLENERNITN